MRMKRIEAEEDREDQGMGEAERYESLSYSQGMARRGRGGGSYLKRPEKRAEAEGALVFLYLARVSQINLSFP